MKPDTSQSGSPLIWLGRLADAAVAAVALACSIAILAHPYRYYQDDALFYLQIARSIAEGAGPSFFPGLPTNGFHPFWMLVCVAAASLFGSKAALGVAIAVIMAILNIGTALMIRFGLRRWLPGAALSAGLLIGLPYIFFAGVGMESSLVAFLYASFIVRAARQLERPSGRGLVDCAGLAGLAVFARLDMAIGLAPVILLIFWHLVRDRPAPKRLAIWLPLALVAGSVPALGWIAFNIHAFGDAIPVSGKLKLAAGASGGLFLTGMNKLHLGIALASLALPFVAQGRIYRIAGAVCAGQLLYLGYLLTAGYPEVYSWYYVPLALAAVIGMAALLAGIGRSRTGQRLGSVMPGKVAVFGLAMALMLAAGAKVIAFIEKPGMRMADYEGPTSLSAVAARNGVHHVLVFDRPGQIAYLDGLGTLAVDGLTTNLAFQKLLRERGMNWAIQTYRIDGFVGPKFGREWGPDICGRTYLGSTRYVCDAAKSRITGVEFLSRLDGQPIGAIDLTTAKRPVFAPDRGLALYILPR